MPRSSRYRKRRRFVRRGRGFKKSYRRRYAGRYKSTKKISKKKLGVIVPDEAWIKFKYTYFIQDTAGAGNTTVVECFRGNGPYDPYQTGIGTQPQGFDQWLGANAFYQRYYVSASKIKVVLDNQTPNDGTIITVIPSKDVYSIASSASNAVYMQPYNMTKYLAEQGNGNTRAKFLYYMTTNKMWGQRGCEVEEDFSALYNTTPANQWYWNIIIQSSSGTVGVTKVSGFVTVTYYCKCFFRTALANS